MRPITHAAVGILIAKVLGLDPFYVLAGALIPDLDYIWGHRKTLHNIFVTGLLWWMNPAVGIGAASHVLLDMLTIAGAALFWPLTNKRFGIRVARTGGALDLALQIGAIVLFLLA